jgi:hypothetical protein
MQASPAKFVVSPLVVSLEARVWSRRKLVHGSMQYGESTRALGSEDWRVVDR